MKKYSKAWTDDTDEN